jgi:hypothetical protein
MNGSLEGNRKLIVAGAMILGTFIMLGIGRMPPEMAEKILLLIGAAYFGIDTVQKIFYGTLSAKPPEEKKTNV